VPTLVSTSLLSVPMHFSINASSSVSFTGEVHVHGLMMHEFEGNSGMKLMLNARARQFSCFLVLVGRIAGPGLFDPQFGMICQNKDDISIPLDIETIPSAGEFKVKKKKFLGLFNSLKKQKRKKGCNSFDFSRSASVCTDVSRNATLIDTVWSLCCANQTSARKIAQFER
jgi:hypothetical protein